MIIAIDGPAGSGKSTTAKLVAGALKIVHLDTGAMYRAITLKCLRENVSFNDEAALSAIMRNTALSFTGSPPEMKVWMDGNDVSAAIRGDEVTSNVSDYCAVGLVREKLVQLQRTMGRGKSVVCEGRDIGTVVFPSADLKFFMVASLEARAERRKADFARMGVEKSIDELKSEIAERDRKDSSRQLSPLCKADDAEQIDTTVMTIEQQVRYIVDKANKLSRVRQRAHM